MQVVKEFFPELDLNLIHFKKVSVTLIKVTFSKSVKIL